MIRYLCIFLLVGNLVGAPLTYETNPLGTLEKPLILRSYLPDPGLDPAVLTNHGKAAKSPKYNPGKGQDVAGEYEMIKVIPAAIAVNHGPALSYVFDTTECRVLYAWQGGFLDMFPYWGEFEGGRRRSFDYVPRLVGNLFYLAEPIEREKATFVGYDLEKDIPTFRYKIGEKDYWERIEPVTNQPRTFSRLLSADGAKGQDEVSGATISQHSGFDRTIKIDEPNRQAGEQVFLAYGCTACHSIDGSLGHGPSLANLFGSTRAIENGDPVLADESYLKESILAPNAKTAKGFPPNYMPPYQLKEKELQSLLLYLKSLTNSSAE